MASDSMIVTLICITVRYLSFLGLILGLSESFQQQLGAAYRSKHGVVSPIDALSTCISV
jgi:hypothetical protein